jgi:cytochrome bd-type quinol oxidase subunit 2
MEAPTPPSQLRRWSPLWTSLTAVGLYILALAAITSVALNDQVFDFARDLAAAGPALLLVGAALWLWPRPQGRLGRLARTVVLVGLALFGLGEAVQAIGIWGWSWNGAGRYVVSDQGLTQIWEFGHTSTALGELALVVGVVLAMASAVQRRRTDRRGPADPATAATSLALSEPTWGEPGYVPQGQQPPRPRAKLRRSEKLALWSLPVLAFTGRVLYLAGLNDEQYVPSCYRHEGVPYTDQLFLHPVWSIIGAVVAMGAILAVVSMIWGNRHQPPVSMIVVLLLLIASFVGLMFATYPCI